MSDKGRDYVKMFAVRKWKADPYSSLQRDSISYERNYADTLNFIARKSKDAFGTQKKRLRLTFKYEPMFGFICVAKQPIPISDWALMLADSRDLRRTAQLSSLCSSYVSMDSASCSVDKETISSIMSSKSSISCAPYAAAKSFKNQ